jgi:hypothetical protein
MASGLRRATKQGMSAEVTIRARILALLLGATALLAAAHPRAATAGAPTWWKADTHQHSAFSGDAPADLGIDAALDKSLNYNAVFVTDHDRLNSFSIEDANGNYLDYHDALTGRWLRKTVGATSSATNAVVSSPVHSGTNSLHLAATSSSVSNGRTFVYARRGSNLLSSDVTLDFWVYPVRIDSGAGVDVSVSLGGDATSGVSVHGYTTADDVPHIGKSTVLVWQLGAARAATSTATTHVITNVLPYALGTWNHYVIDVTTGAMTWTGAGGATKSLSTSGLSSLSAADQPANYAALTYPKMEASATNGSADAYFDDYVLQVATPHCPAADFVYRNSLIDSGRFNGLNAAGRSFVLFPAREMGQQHHTQQLNFDITSPSQFYDAYSDSVSNDAQLCAATNTVSAPWRFAYYGSDNIASVQASGYPAQTNHPGVTDTTADVISTEAHGAQLIEVQGASDYSSSWDPILQQNHQVIGTYGSDAHEGIGTGDTADFIDAPSLTLTSLVHSLFEGRLYMARNDFGGRVVFNLDSNSPSPYPARYPVTSFANQTSAVVHLAITGGLASGETVRWIYNNGAGDNTITDTPSGVSYNTTKSIPLSGAFTFVRAEVRDAASTLVANTEPIFFERGSALAPPTRRAGSTRKASPRLRIRHVRWHRRRVRLSGQAVRGLRFRVRVSFACGSRRRQSIARRVRVRSGRFAATLQVPRACRNTRRGIVAAAYHGDSRHRPQHVRRRVYRK